MGQAAAERAGVAGDFGAGDLLCAGDGPAFQGVSVLAGGIGPSGCGGDGGGAGFAACKSAAGAREDNLKHGCRTEMSPAIPPHPAMPPEEFNLYCRQAFVTMPVLISKNALCSTVFSSCPPKMRNTAPEDSCFSV